MLFRSRRRYNREQASDRNGVHPPRSIVGHYGCVRVGHIQQSKHSNETAHGYNDFAHYPYAYIEFVGHERLGAVRRGQRCVSIRILDSTRHYSRDTRSGYNHNDKKENVLTTRTAALRILSDFAEGIRFARIMLYFANLS